MQKHSKQAGSVVMIGLLMVVMVAVVAIAGYEIKQQHNKPVTNLATDSSTKSSSTAVQQPLGSGTNNQDLNSDLQNINSSLNQDNQNLQSTNQSFSDQQLTVSD